MPADSLLLAQVAVAANASSILNANITDKRVFISGAIPYGGPAVGTYVAGAFGMETTYGGIWQTASGGSPGTWVPRTPIVLQDSGHIGGTLNYFTAPPTGTLPSGYSTIEITLFVRSSAAAVADTIAMQFNGVASGGPYNSQLLSAFGTTSSGAQTLAANYLRVGDCAAASAPAAVFDEWHVRIPFFSNTTYAKGFSAYGGASTGFGSGGMYQESSYGIWNSSAAISYLTITPLTGGAVWLAGSRMLVRLLP